MNSPLSAARQRPLFRRRAAIAAVMVALLSSAGLTGIARASFYTAGTWGAYDEAGNELNLAVRDIFGTDGSTVLTGPSNARANSWVGGIDGLPDDGPRASEFFINGDLSCETSAPAYYYSNQEFLCWARSISATGATPGPWGEAFPIIAKGIDNTDLVFDHWQISGSPDVDGRCFTGEIGVPQFIGQLIVAGPGGELDPVLSVGYKAFIDFSPPPVGFSGLDFTANAIYAPLNPDTSAPIVSIVRPFDCSVVEAGASLITSFNCIDPGDSDPNPSCVGDVPNGTSVDTSTAGEHSFSVVGTDAGGNTRTRTIHYTVLPATPPDTSITSHPAAATNAASATFNFSGTDNLGVAELQCKLDAAAFGTCTSPRSYSSLGEGSHTFAVRAIDVNGNTDPTPASFTWIVDTIRPIATILDHPDNPSATSTATFEFAGTDVGTGVVGFECSVQLGTPGLPVPCNDIDPLTGAHVSTFTGLTDGNWVFQVNAVDAAGNRDLGTGATFAWTINTIPVQPVFSGFLQPVDTNALNVAKAGKVVPVKWRLVDANGLPVTSWPTATITATSLSCSLGSTPDQIEEYAAGASGLQNLGNGYYQFNWATPKSYANSCKTLHLALGDGTDHTAQFQFTK